MLLDINRDAAKAEKHARRDSTEARALANIRAMSEVRMHHKLSAELTRSRYSQIIISSPSASRPAGSQLLLQHPWQTRIAHRPRLTRSLLRLASL